MSDRIQILFAGEPGGREALRLRLAPWPVAALDDADAPSGGSCVVLVPDGDAAPVRIAELKARRPEARVLVLIEAVRAGRLRALVDAGADAVAAASLPVQALRDIVEALAEGGALPVAQGVAEPVPDADALTPREAEVLRLLSAGFSNKEVARRLAVSVRTVETHRLNLRRKTQTGRLRDLVQLARRLNLQPVTEAEIRGPAAPRPKPGPWHWERRC